MPDRTIYKPLPDIFTDNIMAFPRALDVSDVLLAMGYNLTNILLVFHKHRWVLFSIVLYLIYYPYAPLTR
jgi:shingomyelin synthase